MWQRWRYQWSFFARALHPQTRGEILKVLLARIILRPQHAVGGPREPYRAWRMNGVRLLPARFLVPCFLLPVRRIRNAPHALRSEGNLFTYVFSNFFLPLNLAVFFCKLSEARSRLYRSRIFQVHTRLNSYLVRKED